ncbi:28S ribosomal protein S22, mitochondrial [Lamellibrachia satsuma]|nr:28S ribosomal protein S22, mitochondrial [Lamellibrachia satsuma]
MAAPAATRVFSVVHRILTRNSVRCTGHATRNARHLCSGEPGGRSPADAQDPGALFIQTEVQDILQRVTGFDLDKIFHERPAKNLQPAKYHLLTEKQLQEIQDGAMERGRNRLQMPPVMKCREDVEHILSDDPEIDGFEEHRYVFTDISYNLPDRSRSIVVREPSGKLRMATHDERDRMLQVYFPVPGRMYNIPEMFQEENIEKLLREGKYEYVLDRACIQFEPDDGNYIRVTQRTYEHIASLGEYDQLRSTRHFGCMAFYFAYYKKIDGLLVDMIQRDFLGDAADLVRLYHILHPNCESAQQVKVQKVKDEQELIQLYLKFDSHHGGMVELALQTYNESQGQTQTHSSN